MRTTGFQHLACRGHTLLYFLFVVLAATACTVNEPLLHEKSGDLVDCPDLDLDGFGGHGGGCGPRDCNDAEYYFYTPESGYCDSHDYLLLDPYETQHAVDFALWFDDNDMMNIYYTRNVGWPSNEFTSREFGHERSPDLIDWEYVGQILSVTEVAEGDWDDDHVWAPSMVEYDSVYYMYYTGVTMAHPPGSTPADHEERIGLATSTDLITWTRYPGNHCQDTTGDGCLCDCDWDWTRWGNGSAWANGCRDPFVFWDDVNAAWYMTYTTTYNPTGDVVGLAKSVDMTSWEDLGPIMPTRDTVAESSHIVRINGYYYLFWTFHGDGEVKYSYTDDLEADSWTEATEFTDVLYLLATEISEIKGFQLLAYVFTGNGDIHFRIVDILEDHTLQVKTISALSCDPIDPADVYPGAIEISNGVDDNCNGSVDEPQGECIDSDGDYYGDPMSDFCAYHDLDCDDTNPAVNPGAGEDCLTPYDDNCNGLTNEFCGPRKLIWHRY